MNATEMIQTFLYEDTDVTYMTATPEQARAAAKRLMAYLDEKGWVYHVHGSRIYLDHTGAWVRFYPCTRDGVAFEHTPVLFLEDKEHMNPQAAAEARMIPAPTPKMTEPLIIEILAQGR